MSEIPDPVDLAQSLIRCPSVTPDDAGALDLLQDVLEKLGFSCHRLPFSQPGTPDVDNLYARIGSGSPNFCFAGHTDVVPPGNVADWTHDPFSGEIDNDRLYGRGAVDMKAAVACFIAAAGRYLAENNGPGNGSVSLLVTGDEEGPAINGTARVLDWMKDQGEVIDACLVGEPTNPSKLGEMIKIGRRGNLYGHITVRGIQGHSAYPEMADNPIPHLMRMLATLGEAQLDNGSDHFQPSKLVITSIDVGNRVTNVIPGRAAANFNIRFNDLHTADSLKTWLEEQLEREQAAYDLSIEVSGEAFLTPPGDLSNIVSAAVEKVTEHRPSLSTTGGSSDARFIRKHCPVVEFGLISDCAHRVDESAAVTDIVKLSEIYLETLRGFFSDRR